LLFPFALERLVEEVFSFPSFVFFLFSAFRSFLIVFRPGFFSLARAVLFSGLSFSSSHPSVPAFLPPPVMTYSFLFFFFEILHFYVLDALNTIMAAFSQEPVISWRASLASFSPFPVRQSERFALIELPRYHPARLPLFLQPRPLSFPMTMSFSAKGDSFFPFPSRTPYFTLSPGCASGGRLRFFCLELFSVNAQTDALSPSTFTPVSSPHCSKKAFKMRPSLPECDSSA